MLETVSIQDSVSGAAAEFLPGRGMTCCSATLAAGVELVEVIWCPDGFREAGARASSGGIPILCPYPGRLASTRMEFEGRVFELEPADPLGRPIHGFAHDRPWQVIDRTESSVTASSLRAPRPDNSRHMNSVMATIHFVARPSTRRCRAAGR